MDKKAWQARSMGFLRVRQNWACMHTPDYKSIYCQFVEKEMAIHSSTLAWKIPWMEEPGGLQPMGLQGVGHDWVTSLHSLHTLSLEKEMATHSSILAWRIPWTEEQVGHGPWGHRELDTTEVTEHAPIVSLKFVDWFHFPISNGSTQTLLKFLSIESVRPSNHLILCHPLLFLPSIFLSIRVFSKESVLFIRWPKYWSFSFSISPSNEYSGLISFRIDWLDLLTVQGTLRSLLQHQSSKASILLHSDFYIVQL